jgi:biotin-dependent carboxylase-like uncharacterized protein
MLEVLQPGLYTTVQDLGRPGHRSYGIPHSGALDPYLARIANRLAGNDEGQALLEFALIGPTLKALSETWLAVTGGSIQYLVNGRQTPEYSAFPLHAGDILQFVAMKGWFGYLAISGGLMCEHIMGSASSYEGGRIGSRLQRGWSLRCGKPAQRMYAVRKERLDVIPVASLPILPALHTSLFSAPERHRLVRKEFHIAVQSNRMGIHLEGVPILPPHVQRSAPALSGAIQVPRSGQLIILGPEGPTTGGYPQIAILCRSAWTTLASTRPGEPLRFHWTDAETARKADLRRHEILQREDTWQSVT